MSRIWPVVIALCALGACGDKDSDGDVSDDGAADTADGTGGGVDAGGDTAGDDEGSDTATSPTTETDCDDGLDDDGDGLLDCEDGDCAEDEACGERCNNGVDDDGDGLLDCVDDECWPEEVCQYEVLESWATGGEMTVEELLVRHALTQGGTNSYTSTMTYTRRAALARDVAGFTRQILPDGTSTTCGWTVDTMSATMTVDERFHAGPHSWYDMGAAERTGLTVDEPCFAVFGMLPRNQLLVSWDMLGAPGIWWVDDFGSGRTTYAHWYQGEIATSSNAFVGSWTLSGSGYDLRGTYWSYTASRTLTLGVGDMWVAP